MEKDAYHTGSQDAHICIWQVDEIVLGNKLEIPGRDVIEHIESCNCSEDFTDDVDDHIYTL